MIVIRSVTDIQALRHDSSVDTLVAQYIERYFHTLAKTYGYAQSINSFSLEENGGCVVFLQTAEDCNRLSDMGLHTDYKGTFPEITALIPLQSKGSMVPLFKSTIAINNEYAVDVFSVKGTLDDETEQFLMDECAGSGPVSK